MATVEYLAVSAAAATGADLTVTAAVPVTISLKTAVDGGLHQFSNVTVQFKSAGGQYQDCGSVTGTNPVRVLSAVGTYRLVKAAAPVAYGVDVSS